MEDASRSEQAQQMIDYIAREVIRRPDIAITKETPLVSSGLMDSLALVGILSKLEDVTRMRIPVGKLRPKDMETVALMLAAAQRLGKPWK